MQQPSRSDIAQFGRYLLTGVLNTLVTLLAIFLCKGILGVNPWVSNAIGYVAGLVNSFLWNRIFVFHSHSSHWRRQSLRFLAGFLLCYGLQLAVTYILTAHVIRPDFLWRLPGIAISGYGIATLVGMMAYTIANYLYNRCLVFRV